jgi:hypothetical protein
MKKYLPPDQIKKFPISYFDYLFSYLFIIFDAGDQTQGLALARPELFH